MNFVIAVVGESYEKCMVSMNAETYRSKLDMILECELFKNYMKNSIPESWKYDESKLNPV
jgi:hypothetical protein